MELMDGSLHQLINEKMENNATLVAPFDLFKVVDIMPQMAEGMHCLHEKNVVHRILKSMNILVKHVPEIIGGTRVHASQSGGLRDVESEGNDLQFVQLDIRHGHNAMDGTRTILQYFSKIEF